VNREETIMAKTKTFEENMAELESVVESLGEGDITLDESLKLFEKGIKLSNACQNMLDKAEQKVTVLISENDEVIEEDFVKD
jgi:exodeoxyribonuclease VII small subunit